MDYSLLNGLNSAKKLTAADKANLFTERMSSTAHQREVEDLQKAGLNPVLSANSSGASTGSAAQDSDETTYNNPIYKLVNSVNTIANSTAKSLSEATKSLSDVVKKSTNKDKKDEDKIGDDVAEDIAKDIITTIANHGPSDAKKNLVENYGANYKSAPDLTYNENNKLTGAASKLPSQIKNVINTFDAMYGKKYNISLTKLVNSIFGEKSNNMYIRALQNGVNSLNYNASDYDKLFTGIFRNAKKGIEKKAKKRSNTDYGKGIVVGKKKTGNYGHGAHGTYNVRMER